MMNGKFPLVCSLLLLTACSGGDDEGGMETLDGGSDVSACATTPTRLVVLGDSIAACFGVDGKESATCGPKIFHDSLAAGYAPGITYENLAVSGAITTDVVDTQLDTVPTGPGHVMVLIYIGGNDLQMYLSQADAAAEAGFNADLPGILEDWQSIYAFFSDTAKFPDGATIVMNNQYNPFDDCTAAPYDFITPAKISLLAQYNSELETLADGQANAYITDQHTPYLGHGHHYNVDTCPFYQPGQVPFMEDLIHPNVAGHANLAVQWDAMADSLFSGCE